MGRGREVWWYEVVGEDRGVVVGVGGLERSGFWERLGEKDVGVWM